MSKNNTKTTNNGSWTTITLHQTDIVKYNDSTIVLNSGGYRTATTKRRMNQVLQSINSRAKVFQHQNKWYVSDRTGGIQDFQDGMAIYY